jgi:hypothetical protein
MTPEDKQWAEALQALQALKSMAEGVELMTAKRLEALANDPERALRRKLMGQATPIFDDPANLDSAGRPEWRSRLGVSCNRDAERYP